MKISSTSWAAVFLLWVCGVSLRIIPLIVAVVFVAVGNPDRIAGISVGTGSAQVQLRDAVSKATATVDQVRHLAVQMATLAIEQNAELDRQGFDAKRSDARKADVLKTLADLGVSDDELHRLPDSSSPTMLSSPARRGMRINGEDLDARRTAYERLGKFQAASDFAQCGKLAVRSLCPVPRLEFFDRRLLCPETGVDDVQADPIIEVYRVVPLSQRRDLPRRSGADLFFLG